MTPETLDAAWRAAWSDFLSNRVLLAERRATPLVREHLPAALDAAQSSDDAMLADRLVTLADLAHIAGACGNDAALLRQSIAAYDAHLRLSPSNTSAMRMRAETLLRSRDLSGAFQAFRALYDASLAASSEVAPFQLLHDAEVAEDAVRLGADPTALATAAAWRDLAAQLGAGDEEAATRRVAVSSLSASQRALLGSHGWPLPSPPPASEAPPERALRQSIDWGGAVAEYSAKRCVVLDDLLSPAALHALQAYTRHGAHFRTLRRGYLGCFPADGMTHPLVQSLAAELAAAAPSIFGPHPLALWWIFKYDSAVNPSGIGIHADPAAVNINLWLTDDDAHHEGGGLAIYEHVPPLEQPTQNVNREYESRAAEAALRETLLRAGRVTRVEYRCNRAAIFVSDQYHESLPFSFARGYAQRRANLTLLFGDRWSSEVVAAGAEQGGTGGGWDLFD